MRRNGNYILCVIVMIKVELGGGGGYGRSLLDGGPAMSIRPKTSDLRMPSTYHAIRNANHS